MSEKIAFMLATASSEKIPCDLSIGVTMLTDDGCSQETDGCSLQVPEWPTILSTRSCNDSHSIGSSQETLG